MYVVMVCMFVCMFVCMYLGMCSFMLCVFVVAHMCVLVGAFRVCRHVEYSAAFSCSVNDTRSPVYL